MKKIFYSVLLMGILLTGFLFLRKEHGAWFATEPASGLYYSIAEYTYFDSDRERDDPHSKSSVHQIKKIGKWPSKDTCEAYIKLTAEELHKPVSAVCRKGGWQYDKYFFNPKPMSEYFFTYFVKNRDASTNGVSSVPMASAVIINFNATIIKYESKLVPDPPPLSSRHAQAVFPHTAGYREMPIKYKMTEKDRLNSLRDVITDELVINRSPVNDSREFIVDLKVFSPDKEISSLYSDLIKTEVWFDAEEKLDRANDSFSQINSVDQERCRDVCNLYWEAFNLHKGPFGVTDIRNAFNSCSKSGDRIKKDEFEKFSSEYNRRDTSALVTAG